MATSVRTPASTREKLLRAKDAAARLAQLTTAQKNELLLAMADAIEANTASIIAANQSDLTSSGLAGAMRDRLLLNPRAHRGDGERASARSPAWLIRSAKPWRSGLAPTGCASAK